MEKLIQKRKTRYEVIKQNNDTPKKLSVTENQRKVITDKYLKNAPSMEGWLRGVAKNIALAELLHLPEFKKKVFDGVDFKDVTTKFKRKDVADITIQYVHSDKPSFSMKEKNFKKFMQNLNNLVDVDGKAAEIVKYHEDLFYGMMARWDFLPNSPTLMNAGRDLQQLSACYVLPIEDSVEGWGNTVKNTMLIHKSGGGTGFSGARVRSQGSMVMSTRGIASGPLSVFKMVDGMTEQIKQGGTRRGANMGILPYWHPDIKTFITCKNDSTFLENFNISVALDKKFMDAVNNDGDIELKNPNDGKITETVKAKEIWDMMINNAWASGDPGFVMIDRINNSNSNPTPKVGQIESTNPCGEQPLLPFEPCNLGSINLSNFVIEEESPKLDWDRLGDIASLATHFLDNVIDVNNYPLPEIEAMAKNNRRIGLGVMGWGEMLSKLKIPYNSDKAFKLADEIMKFINDASLQTSIALAAERGVFPNWEDSIYDKDSKYFRDVDATPRNCARTTIAPTGTIGITAGLQGAGIEPFFAIVYTRYNAAGIDALKLGEDPAEKDTFYEVNTLFRKIAEKNDFWGVEETELWKKIVDHHGSVQGVPEIPADVQSWFLTSHDLTPSDHVNVQAAFQRHTDNGVSKTVNLRNDATADDVRAVYEMAYEAGCKGVTIYRDGSKGQQVLNIKKKDKKEAKTETTEIVVKPEGAIITAEELAPVKGSDDEASTYYRIQSGYGPLHVHINYNEKGPTKVFANLTPTGTEISGMTTAMGILISKYFELGGDPVRILKHLNSIKGDRPHGFGIKRIDSIPHAIAVALKDHLVKTEKLEDSQTTLVKKGDKDESLMKFSNNMYCSKCYSANVAMVSGCSEPTCFDCGYSKCS